MPRRHLRLVSLLVVLAALSVVGFENAQMKKRRKKIKEASSYLRIPHFSQEQQQCAACEAIAQNFEELMREDKHKGGYVEQMAIVNSVCDGIDDKYMPSDMEAPKAAEGADAESKVLHFAKIPPGKRGGVGEIPRTGLSEFCTALTEEFEDDLLTMVAEAEPVDSALTKQLGIGSGGADAMPRYELKDATCVRVTQSCSSEGLHAISNARITMGLGSMPAEQKAKFEDYLKTMAMKQQVQDATQAAQRMAEGASAEEIIQEAALKEAAGKPKKEAVRAEKIFEKKKKEGKKWKGKSKPSPKKEGSSPLEAIDWMVQKPYAALASLTATVSVVYVGGMVARVW